MAKFLFDSDDLAYWPHKSIMNVLNQVYDNVTHIEDDNNQRFYEIELKGLKFLAILVHETNSPEKILNFGFMSYFAGFDITETGTEALNRNLHISIAEIDDSQNLILFSFLDANGAFDENRFSLILEAWHRDIVITLKMIMPTSSFSATMPSRRLEMAKVYGLNGLARSSNQQDQEFALSMSAQQTGETNDHVVELELQKQSSEILARFLGAGDASRTLCSECDGRGRKPLLGTIVMRHCTNCDGSGLSAPTIK